MGIKRHNPEGYVSPHDYDKEREQVLEAQADGRVKIY